MYKETLKMNKYDCTIGYFEHGCHKGGRAGFWIFCKSYSKPKSSNMVGISFKHLQKLCIFAKFGRHSSRIKYALTGLLRTLDKSRRTSPGLRDLNNSKFRPPSSLSSRTTLLVPVLVERFPYLQLPAGAEFLNNGILYPSMKAANKTRQDKTRQDKILDP